MEENDLLCWRTFPKTRRHTVRLAGVERRWANEKPGHGEPFTLSAEAFRFMHDSHLRLMVYSSTDLDNQTGVELQLGSFPRSQKVERGCSWWWASELLRLLVGCVPHDWGPLLCLANGWRIFNALGGCCVVLKSVLLGNLVYQFLLHLAKKSYMTECHQGHCMFTPLSCPFVYSL